MYKEENIVKENNAGGLSIERWINDEIVEVVSGLEYGNQNGILDVLTFGDEWTATDAGGNTVGYYANGNTSGDIDNDGDELTASEAVDDDDSTQIIAEYDGKTLKLYIDVMGNAGCRYFGVKTN